MDVYYILIVILTASAIFIGKYFNIILTIPLFLIGTVLLIASKLNLTKIQSMPKIKTPWRYSFFVDITFEDIKDYLKAKSIIMIMAKEFKVLGEYNNSKDD